MDSIKISESLTLFYSLRDIAGPSYDLGFDRVDAFHNYEKEDKDLILKYIKPKSVFMDIGANIGHFSFYFKEKHPDLECHLFEPNPKLYQCINMSLKASKLNGVFPHQLALSNSNGEASFFIDSYNDGGHSLLIDKISAKSKDTQKVTVKTIRLDEFVNERNLEKIDIIKVDIQGAERSFIEGGIETINKNKPVMMIEVDSEKVGEFFSFLSDVLSFEVDIFYFKNNRPLKLEQLKALGMELKQKGHKEANFLIVPK